MPILNKKHLLMFFNYIFYVSASLLVIFSLLCLLKSVIC